MAETVGTPANRAVTPALAESGAVREAWGHVAAIVLAAGGSTRYGQPKQLLPWKDTTLVGHAVRLARTADGVGQVIVVVGHRAEQVAAAVREEEQRVRQGMPARVVVNRHWEAGQSTSVRAGLAAVASGASAALFLLVDQPEVPPHVLTALIQRHRQTLAPIVVPTYRGQRGNPVLFDRTLFAELSLLKGDVGGRSLIVRYADRLECVAVSTAGILRDIDTPEDYGLSLQAVGIFGKNRV